MLEKAEIGELSNDLTGKLAVESHIFIVSTEGPTKCCYF